MDNKSSYFRRGNYESDSRDRAVSTNDSRNDGRVEIGLIFIDKNSRHTHATPNQNFNHKIDALSKQIDDIPFALLLEAFIGHMALHGQVLLATFAKNPNVAHCFKADYEHLEAWSSGLQNHPRFSVHFIVILLQPNQIDEFFGCAPTKFHGVDFT